MMRKFMALVAAGILTAGLVTAGEAEQQEASQLQPRDLIQGFYRDVFNGHDVSKIDL